MGHCNVQTDIKEAVFLGESDELVACGSDDGRIFIYRADTGEFEHTIFGCTVAIDVCGFVCHVPGLALGC
jgi:WD40 repeat protein